MGEAWPLERILKLKKTVEDAGMELSVIESVPVHEDIKMGCGDRDRYIDNYCTTLRNMVNMTGVPLPMAVKMASENPAKFLGVEKTGKLEPGYFADVTLFDRDINIEMTIVNGKEVYRAE